MPRVPFCYRASRAKIPVLCLLKKVNFLSGSAGLLYNILVWDAGGPPQLLFRLSLPLFLKNSNWSQNTNENFFIHRFKITTL